MIGPFEFVNNRRVLYGADRIDESSTKMRPRPNGSPASWKQKGSATSYMIR